MKYAETRLFVLALVLLAVTASAWARIYPLTAAQIVPAAAGSIETSTDKNGNTEVDLKVDRLAQPSSLTPPANIYIVWFQEPGSQPQKEAQLRVDGKLKGELKTTTTLKSFQVLITAETDPTATVPSEQQVLRATVQS